MPQDKPKYKRPFFTNRSISRDLTLSLVVIVLLIATAMGGYIYWQQTEEMWANAEEKGEDTITSVAEILAVPIWNLDYDNARLIGSVYTHNDVVQGIRIYGSRNEVVFAHEKFSGNQADFSKVRSIVFEGRTIGRAEIDFTLAKDKKRLNEQMFVSSMIIVVAISVILAITGLLLRVFLNKPLQVLQQGIARVAKGDFSYEFGEVYHAELLEIAKRFRRMSAEIEAREKKLQAMNKTLQEAEEKYRGIFENAIEGIFQATPDGVLRRANPAMARIFGYDSLDEFLANVRSLGSRVMVNPESMQDFYEHVREQGEVKRFEAEYYRRDGKTIWGALNARAIYNENKELIFIEGILEDITDRKKAEHDLADLNRHLEQLVRERTEDLVNKARELEDANQRLRELDEMKSAFLSSVSHELRTPLTSILGFSKLLHKDFKKNFMPLAKNDDLLVRRGNRIRENLTIISHEGERLTRLINDVLDLNKIESGRMGWRDEPINMADTIEMAVQAVKGMFSGNSHIDLITDVDHDLPLIVADPDRMQQVLINLLNNASKFTDEGSVVVRAFPRFGQVRVEVTDTGSGIATEDQAQIFEKFHQTRNDTMEEKPKGTGLGLTICREIVEHYGGRIWVESEIGVGSTFIFTIPATS
ncbi:PAS/PAC sensor signal transduction histidine kinase [Pseudodesulfovibrio profundus]|uniref:histidine kinase n=1 Tax=Pseudodesulfovibrio profundus TaxID=57320 RepID=A0A2C8F9K8_9BACT|nr:ATP-binding protein [Pseudodesulfovibrio profundus]MBC17721.1 PAS domain-containing sensor histidine kinase [Desulfovibrio sp.]SOB59124.1 PAS/PAC sensor signal transduction histidine kinase [Pseudodesulfovibrio profundus]|tara:strand:- start:20621 stop:22552 length:1932 start_codon:yes stop_codon:yes gene_type:complete